MLCPSCRKLLFTPGNKKCVRCQNVVSNSPSALCEPCSANNKQCSVCMKKVISQAERNAGRGCGCHGKK